MSEVRQNPYTQYQYQQQFGSYNVPSKGLEDVKSKNRLLGAVADTVDTPGKGNMGTSFLMSLLASIGIVKGTNYLLQPKTITDKMTQYDTYTNSRLYRAGKAIDNWGPFRWISNKATAIKNSLSRMNPPDYIKEIGRKWRIGSVATWDKTGMWTKGKSAEAINEFLGYLSEASLKDLKLSKHDFKIVDETLKLFKAQKINPSDAFKKIAPKIKNVNAKTLAAASGKSGLLARLFGTSKNLNLSLSKAQTLVGESGGVVGKATGKITTMLGEASGGGVLGGPFALLLNAFFIGQNLNEARKAEDGEKLKTFMDEFFGTTLGSYLMQMYMGKKFNDFLGFAELGMDLNSPEMKKVIKNLKVQDPKRVLDVVTAYNKMISQNKKLQNAVAAMGSDKMSLANVIKLIDKCGLEAGAKDKALIDLLSKINSGMVLPKGAPKVKGAISVGDALKILKRYNINPKSKSLEGVADAAAKNLKPSVMKLMNKNIKGQKELQTMYKAIKGATKSNITFSSVFKKTKGTSFLGRLGKYITQKPLAVMSRFLATGRYTVTKPDAGFLRKFGGAFKRIGGGIGRMLLVAFVLTPPIAALFTKFSHAVFGKPKKKIEEEAQAKAQEQMQNYLQQPMTQNVNEEYVPFSNQKKNLVEMYTGVPTSSNNGGQYVLPGQNSQSAVQQDKPNYINNFDKATYVPNQMLTQESFIDQNLTQDLLSRRDLALQHADWAEKNANDVLSKT